MRKTSRIVGRRMAGNAHAVLSVVGGGAGFRRRPCGDCPWRRDAVGGFPAEAFIHSANTAMASIASADDIDGATHAFACHQSGADKPATCAGYILRAQDTISWRMNVVTGQFDPREVSDGGIPLWPGYYEMAVANGVDPEHEALLPLERGGEELATRHMRESKLRLAKMKALKPI